MALPRCAWSPMTMASSRTSCAASPRLAARCGWPRRGLAQAAGCCGAAAAGRAAAPRLAATPGPQPAGRQPASDAPPALPALLPRQVTVVPADYPAEKVLDMNPDGVFFSNGPVSGACGDCSPAQSGDLAGRMAVCAHLLPGPPAVCRRSAEPPAAPPHAAPLQGDPSAVPYAVENAKQILGKKPVFGICMGHQVGWPHTAQALRGEGGGMAGIRAGSARLLQLAVCCWSRTGPPAQPQHAARPPLPVGVRRCWARPLAARPSSSSLGTTAATTHCGTPPPVRLQPARCPGTRHPFAGSQAAAPTQPRCAPARRTRIRARPQHCSLTVLPQLHPALHCLVPACSRQSLRDPAALPQPAPHPLPYAPPQGASRSARRTTTLRWTPPRCHPRSR